VISPVPQIEQFRLESNWEFLVVATDGVWDAMSNADILKYLASRLDNKNRYKDKDREGTRYKDISTRTKTALGTGTYLRTRTGAVLGTGTVLRKLWKEKFNLTKLSVT